MKRVERENVTAAADATPGKPEGRLSADVSAYRLESVTFDRLDRGDRRFEISSFVEPSELQDSLAAEGMVTPLCLFETENERFIVVDGFKRLRWLEDSDQPRFQALVHPPGTNLAVLWRKRIEAKLFGPPLNLAEKAQVVQKAAEFYPPAEVFRRILPVLGLSGRAESVAAWCRVSRWNVGHLEALARQVIGERAALLLTRWDEGSRSAAVRVLDLLRCSASLQVEILERVHDLALRDDLLPSEVLGRAELREILDSEELNRREKTQAVRERLFDWYAPRLRARREHFARELERLGLPAAVRIEPPTAFEGGTWRAQIDFSNAEDLEERARLFQRLAESGAVERLMRGPR